MIQLEPADTACVLTLLDGFKQKVLPYAICQGINPGKVFVDQRAAPRLALIWSPVGYYFLVGRPDEAEDRNQIKLLLMETFIPASQAHGETGFILIPGSGGWKEHLPELLPGRKIIEIFRRPLWFAGSQFRQATDWRNRLPAGFSLRQMDAALAEQAGVLASWASLDDFLSHGLGFALLEGDKIASVCLSVFASRERYEIDIQTSEEYRRRGFAMHVASAFIEECLRRGMQPNWECFWDNLPSTALALRLGFKSEPDYPVYYWEEAHRG